jgi:hypothetical protein
MHRFELLRHASTTLPDEPERARVFVRSRSGATARSPICSAVTAAVFTLSSLHPAAIAAFALTLSSTKPAGAQSVDGEFTVQRFDPAPGPRNFVTTRGARTEGEMAWSLGAMVNYASLPFVLFSCESETNCDNPNPFQPTDVEVVQSLTTLDMMGTLTFVPTFQLGLKVPVTRVVGQGLTTGDDPPGQPPGRARPGGIEKFALGDVELEGKLRFAEPNATFVPGLALFATAPLGRITAEHTYVGDQTPSVGLRGIADLSAGMLIAAANLAGVFRGESTVGTTKQGAEMRYGAALGVKPSPLISVFVDAFGAADFRSANATNGLELDGAVRFQPFGSLFAFTAGAGFPILDEVGIPQYRLFLGVTYTQERLDRDKDGVFDSDDRCPLVPEGKDLEGEGDGCPSNDIDGDTIENSADKCKNVPEDPDGFEDVDGCPENDNDKDGIKDEADRCPDQPETKNGHDDEDGCPDEPDRDRDGVPDSTDACRREPEDTDNYQDEDGCPDPDNDKDGIKDVKDQCVDQPETENGKDDEDGCPD